MVDQIPLPAASQLSSSDVDRIVRARRCCLWHSLGQAMTFLDSVRTKTRNAGLGLTEPETHLDYQVTQLARGMIIMVSAPSDRDAECSGNVDEECERSGEVQDEVDDIADIVSRNHRRDDKEDKVGRLGVSVSGTTNWRHGFRPGLAG